MHQKQFALIRALEHHGGGARPLQKLRPERRRKRFAAGFGEGQDGDLRRFDALPAGCVIAADGGQEDQHLADQHIGQREKKQPPREALGHKPPGIAQPGAEPFGHGPH